MLPAGLRYAPGLGRCIRQRHPPCLPADRVAGAQLHSTGKRSHPAFSPTPPDQQPHWVFAALQWASLGLRGPPRPGLTKPGPRLYEPAGKRFQLLQGDSNTSRVFQRAPYWLLLPACHGAAVTAEEVQPGAGGAAGRAMSRPTPGTGSASTTSASRAIASCTSSPCRTRCGPPADLPFAVLRRPAQTGSLRWCCSLAATLPLVPAAEFGGWRHPDGGVQRLLQRRSDLLPGRL